MAGKYNDKKVYVNGTTPAINDTNLNGTENQIEDNTNQIGRIQSKFGLNGATLTNVTETSGEIDIDVAQVTGTVEQVNSAQTLGYRNIKVDVANLDASNNLYYKLDDRLTVTTDYTTSYDSKTLDVIAQSTTSQGVQFSSDGTKAYVIDNNTDDIFQYTLSTPWDISTGSYASKSLSTTSEGISPKDLFLSSDGTKVYMLDNNNPTSLKAYQYTLSTPWDISTGSYASKSLDFASEETSLSGIFIGDSGTKLYIVGITNNTIFQYTLSTPWDISTGSYASKSLSVNSEESNPSGMFFSSDGTKAFVIGTSGDSVYQYTLSTAWDISTGSYDSISFSVATQGTTPTGIAFKTDGTKFYVIDSSNDIFQYSTSGAWRVDNYSETIITNTPILANTEITTNGTHIIDLSAINLTTYPNDLVLTYQLDRDSSGDISPTISNHSITWEGIPKGVWVELDGDVTTVDGATVSISTSTSYDQYKLKAHVIGASASASSLVATINLDTGANYDYVNDQLGGTGDTRDPTANWFEITRANNFSNDYPVDIEVIIEPPTTLLGNSYYQMKTNSNSGLLNRAYNYIGRGFYNSSLAFSSIQLKVGAGHDISTGTVWKLYGRNL